MLLALAAIWGSSFLFIKVAVGELTPGVGRLGPRARRDGRAAAGDPVRDRLGPARSGLRRYAFPLFVIALFNASIPFWLLAWSEKRLDSGLAAVLQASTPLFTALLAFGFSRSDRVTGARLVGVLIGFLGVVFLVGAQPSGDVLSALAVLLTALCYAVSALYAGARMSSAPPIVTAFGTLLVATLTMTPLGLAQLPGHAPGWKVTGPASPSARSGSPSPTFSTSRSSPGRRERTPSSSRTSSPRSRSATGRSSSMSPSLPRPSEAWRSSSPESRSARAPSGFRDVRPLGRRRDRDPTRARGRSRLPLRAGERRRRGALPRRTRRARSRLTAARDREVRGGTRGLRPLRRRGPTASARAPWASRSTTAARGSRVSSGLPYPAFRGRRIADEAARLFQHHLFDDLGYHRLQLEIYAFNERAVVHAERSGFVREGVKRRAYSRHGEWVDAILFALLPEDLDSRLLRDHVESFNAGVRSNDWSPMLRRFDDASEMEFRGVRRAVHGRGAIEEAYRDAAAGRRAPHSRAARAGGRVEARYAWLAEPDVAAGEILSDARVTTSVGSSSPSTVV